MGGVGGDGRGAGEQDANVLHAGGTDEVANLLHGLDIVADRGHPVLDAGQLQLGGEGTGLGGLEELELVEEAGVAGGPAEEALLGEFLVVDEGNDGVEVEGGLLVVEHVEDELVGPLLGLDVSRDQNAAVEVVAGGDGLGGLEVGLDLLGGVGLLLGLSAVRRAVDSPGRDEQLGRRRGLAPRGGRGRNKCRRSEGGARCADCRQRGDASGDAHLNAGNRTLHYKCCWGEM